jgi:uncharacterized protein YodC (DUF2158 family)
MEWKVGDVVMLASGGPKMTVSKAVDEDGEVECVWFTTPCVDEDDTGIRIFHFPPAALVKA